MLIRMIRDYIENGQVKVTLRPSKNLAVFWKAGNEMYCSDATGQQLIDDGYAEQVVAEVNPPQEP